MKKKMNSRSNVLRKIIYCLENEECQHMLYWVDKMKKEFIVKFVHMNNPEAKNADYLELFRELDKLSNNFEKYLQDEKYDHKCKVRCKSNLLKLVKSGALTLMGKTWNGKSIQLRRYKLNYNVSGVKSAISNGGKKTKRNNVGSLSGPLLYIYRTTENRNEVSTNAIMQKPPLTVYEHEKHIDGHNGALHINCAESLHLESVGKSIFSHCLSPMEASNEAIKLADTHNPSSGYNNLLQYSNNSPNGFQVEGFQETDFNMNNISQLVPHSPQNYEGFINDLSSQFCDDFGPDVNKPMQQENDPFWSERNSDIVNEKQFEDNESLISNDECSFSFESSDAM